MTKPDVLFVSRSLQHGAGGMQSYARGLLDGLKHEEDIELQVCGFGGPILLLPFFLPFACVRCILFRGTHVHFGDALTALCLPIVRFFRPRLKLGVTAYGLDLTFGNFLYQRAIRRSLPRADTVVAISRATALAAEKLGVDRSRIVVIPCGTDCDAAVAARAEYPRSLLLLGRQIPRKGTRWFLQNVAERLRSLHPELRITVAGDGPELPMIRNDVARLGLPSCVRVLGAVSDEQKETFFREAGLFVMPNVHVDGDMEGFGLVCIEAAARGLPVVAAKLEGIEDAVVDGETGVFFRTADAEDCIAAIKKAWSIPWRSEAVFAACRRQFDLKKMISSYVRDVFR